MGRHRRAYTDVMLHMCSQGVQDSRSRKLQNKVNLDLKKDVDTKRLQFGFDSSSGQGTEYFFFFCLVVFYRQVFALPQLSSKEKEAG